MTDNPYASDFTTSDTTPKTRANRRLVWSGVACIVVAVLCPLVTIVSMMVSFNSIDNSSGTQRPADLAESAALAVIPSYAALPFGILGIVLVVVGLNVRRPVANS
jgi:hypothetical protein